MSDLQHSGQSLYPLSSLPDCDWLSPKVRILLLQAAHKRTYTGVVWTRLFVFNKSKIKWCVTSLFILIICIRLFQFFKRKCRIDWTNLNWFIPDYCTHPSWPKSHISRERKSWYLSYGTAEMAKRKSPVLHSSGTAAHNGGLWGVQKLFKARASTTTEQG